MPKQKEGSNMKTFIEYTLAVTAVLVGTAGEFYMGAKVQRKRTIRPQCIQIS